MFASWDTYVCLNTTNSFSNVSLFLFLVFSYVRVVILMSAFIHKNILVYTTINDIFFSLSFFLPYHHLVEHFAGIFLSLLIFLSIAGNILVCLAIYTERSLRRIGNLFLASLAIADLFVASLVMTFAGVNDLLGMYCLIIIIYLSFLLTFTRTEHEKIVRRKKLLLRVCAPYMSLVG